MQGFASFSADVEVVRTKKLYNQRLMAQEEFIRYSLAVYICLQLLAYKIDGCIWTHKLE